MIRHAAIFWVIVGALFLTALTVVGSEVRHRDQELKQIHAAIARERETIHVLKAEQAYLSAGARIARRAEAELGLIEFDAERIVALADLPDYQPAPDFDFKPEQTGGLLLLSALPEAPEPTSDAFYDVAKFLPSLRLDDARPAADPFWMSIAFRDFSE